VQSEILEKNQSQNLRVYAVWFSMIPSDARSRWNWTGGILDDPRVFHYWDDKKRVGRFYAGKDPETDDPDVVWDSFYLYGKDARWTERPDRELATGTTVRSEFDVLENTLLPLLK
jgi:hypothetical protein